MACFEVGIAILNAKLNSLAISIALGRIWTVYSDRGHSSSGSESRGIRVVEHSRLPEYSTNGTVYPASSVISSSPLHFCPQAVCTESPLEAFALPGCGGTFVAVSDRISAHLSTLLATEEFFCGAAADVCAALWEDLCGVTTRARRRCCNTPVWPVTRPARCWPCWTPRVGQRAR